MFLLRSFPDNFTLDNSIHVLSVWQVNKTTVYWSLKHYWILPLTAFEVKCTMYMILAFIPHPFAYFLISGYLLRTPDNSNFFSISLEGSSYRESTVLYCFIIHNKYKAWLSNILYVHRSGFYYKPTYNVLVWCLGITCTCIDYLTFTWCNYCNNLL